MVRRLKMLICLIFIILSLFSFLGFTPSTEFEINNNNDASSYNTEYYSDLATVIFEPQQKPKFYAFDVNSEGNVALALNDSELQSVLVYDKYGKYVFGLSLNSTGNILVEWAEPNINVIFIRSNIIATYDSNGNCLGVASFTDNAGNGKYCDYLRESNSKTVGTDKYTVSNKPSFLDFIGFNHNSLLRIEANGAQTVVYESNAPLISRDAIVDILVVTVGLVVIAVFVIQTRKKYITTTRE